MSKEITPNGITRRTLTLKELLEFLLGHRVRKISNEQLLIIGIDGATVGRITAGTGGPFPVSVVDGQVRSR